MCKDMRIDMRVAAGMDTCAGMRIDIRRDELRVKIDFGVQHQVEV